jgi:hypothetical protein
VGYRPFFRFILSQNGARQTSRRPFAQSGLPFWCWFPLEPQKFDLNPWMIGIWMIGTWMITMADWQNASQEAHENREKKN